MFSPGQLGQSGGDLATVQGRDNLTQAILNRFYTRQGELTPLGHPNYGSRLYLLIGEMNNTRTRNLAELYMRECLVQEPRIAEIESIEFEPPSRDLHKRNLLIATISLKAVGDPQPLTLQIGLNLEG
jgi:phage baseplate assembly protein W